jgi:hypothetical protein
MRGGSCGRGKGQATVSDAAAVQGETRLARAGDEHIESDARLAMQLSLQVGLCCHLKFTSLFLHHIIILCCCFVNLPAGAWWCLPLVRVRGLSFDACSF